MANIDVTYKGLTGIEVVLTVANTLTIDGLISAIASNEGLPTDYYKVSLGGSPDKNEVSYGDSSATIASMGFVTGSRAICSPSQDGTKQSRMIQKLEIAQEKRQANGDTTKRYYRVKNTYDITQLPTQYIDNVATNNLNGGGLQLGRPWVTFLPKDLFAAGEKGIWFDPSDITSLFQDVAGTIPVTASGQTVALMKDKSGNLAHATQAVAISRPTYYVYPGTGYGTLQFDGINDFMVTSAINFTGTAVMTATTGFQVAATATTGPRIVVELGPDTSAANAGTFYITGPATTLDHSVGLRGTTWAYASFTNHTANPNDDILTAQLNIGAATKELELIPRLNGIVKSGAGLTWGGAANAGTGNFGNYALYIGARSGTSLFFEGKLYGAVVRGATSTAPQITATEDWVTARLY